jgi:hypothetical protein
MAVATAVGPSMADPAGRDLPVIECAWKVCVCALIGEHEDEKRIDIVVTHFPTVPSARFIFPGSVVAFLAATL